MLASGDPKRSPRNAGLSIKAASAFQARNPESRDLTPQEQRPDPAGTTTCQDNNFTGLVVARCCAQALRGEIGHRSEVKRIAVAYDRDGFELEVLVSSESQLPELRKMQPVYRGYLVYWRVERNDKAA